MMEWLQQIVELLPNGYLYLLLLFLIAFTESLPIVGLLMPGSSLVVLAGLLAFHGKGTLPGLMMVTAAGALLGDLLSYWLGEHVGGRLLASRSFQKHRKLVTQAERFFNSHGGKSIFFARFLGPIRGITPFVAGLSRMPGRPFCRYSLISAILWGLAYPGLGFLGGASWQQAQSLSARFGLLVLTALLVTLVHYWLRRGLGLNSGEDNHGDTAG
jgi:undecaprenyl-diphosphatase